MGDDAPGASGALLLRMTVEIGDGRTGELKVHERDDPARLAAAFCREHRLPNKAEQLLRYVWRGLGGGGSAESLVAAMRTRERSKSAPRARAHGARRADDGVFDRLHQDARRKEARKAQLQRSRSDAELHAVQSTPSRISATSRRLLELRGESAGPASERLYSQGMRSLAIRERVAEKAAAQQDPEATFTPTVNPLSARLTTECRRLGGVSGEDRWTRQHQEARRRQLLHHRLSLLHSQSAMRELTLTPVISSESRKIIRLRRSGSAPPLRRTEAARSGPIHNSLYEDAKVKRRALLLKEREMESQIDAASRSRSAAVLRPSSLHRLCHSHEEKEVELDLLRSYLHKPCDEETGQPFFKPRITRGPKRDTRALAPADGAEDSALSADSAFASGLTTGESLHTSRVVARRSRAALLNESREEEEARLREGSKYAKGKSARLVAQARTRRLRQLFDALDTEHDGVIDSASLEARLHALPAEVADSLRPLLASCRGEFLAFSDFRALVERPAAAGPRDFLLPARDKPHHAVESEEARQARECSFAPRVDKRSARLASGRRVAGQPAHDALAEAQAEYEARRSERARQLLDEAAKECTFAPKLTARPPPPPAAGERARPAGGEKPRPPTSDEKEFAEHCTFKPRVNHWKAAVAPRIDTRRALPAEQRRRSAPYVSGTYGAADAAVAWGVYSSSEVSAEGAPPFAEDDDGLSEVVRRAVSEAQLLMDEYQLEPQTPSEAAPAGTPPASERASERKEADPALSTAQLLAMYRRFPPGSGSSGSSPPPPSSRERGSRSSSGGAARHDTALLEKPAGLFASIVKGEQPHASNGGRYSAREREESGLSSPRSEASEALEGRYYSSLRAQL
ncbi:hypothetical protein AB1Y20_016658 [Prymnesium parvum]|uniref:EF-hand domain-containing protein n=1 Tax=Prymnesium parvum TaxID=97485 RepID=A0AB34IC03_PRYPA